MPTTVDTNEKEGIGQVELAGVLCPLMNNSLMVPFSDLIRFPAKQLFGDPSHDDNDLLSSWQMNDWSGGHGVVDLKEGTDLQRYAFATMYGRFPSQLTKGHFFVNNSAGSMEGTGDKMVLGEFWDADLSDFAIVWKSGSTLRRSTMDGSSGYTLDPVTVAAYTSTLSLGTTVNKGVAWAPVSGEEFFYIPCPNNGYYWVAKHSNTTAINSSSTYKFSYLAVWDNKIIGVTSSGRIYHAEDEDPSFPGTGLPNWTLYGTSYRLSKSYRIRGLVNYFDRGDRPCIFIITDRDVWQFDPDGPELFRLDFGWPPHPYHGQAACVWNGELYISVGMGVFRYESGTFVPMGLDRDNGLPAAYQGRIVDMIGGYNGLYALVQSNNADPDGDGGRSSIHEWSGVGWQMIWADDYSYPGTNLTAKTVTAIHLSQSDGVYTLLLSTAGSDDHIYTCPLSISFANPREGIKAGQLFGSGDYYYLDSGEFNANQWGYIKVANAWQVYLEEPIVQTPAMRDDLILEINVDRGGWQEVARYPKAAPGRYSVGFGDPIGDTDFREGLPFEILRYRIFLKRQTSYNADKPTIITNSVISFLKTMDSAESFQLHIDTSTGSADGRYSPIEFANFLDSLTTLRKMTTLKIAGNLYRVFVNQNGGAKGTGSSQVGVRDLSVVQVSTQL